MPRNHQGSDEYIMFLDLIKILQVVKDSVKDVVNLKEKGEREKALLKMLKTYFILYDVHKDGAKLLESVNEDPMEFIKTLNDKELQSHVNIWDQILRRQGVRLYTVQECILSKGYLAVVNPDAVDKISEIVGNKMDRLVTLHGMGASLFFRNIFPIEETPSTIASLAMQSLTKQESGSIDKGAVANELTELKLVLGEFRAIIDKMMEAKEILALSEKARKETSMAT
jgi:hypothetical protein